MKRKLLIFIVAVVCMVVFMQGLLYSFSFDILSQNEHKSRNGGGKLVRGSEGQAFLVESDDADDHHGKHVHTLSDLATRKKDAVKEKEKESDNDKPAFADDGKAISIAVDSHTKDWGGSKYRPEDFPIAVVAYNRAHYLTKCLESLTAVDHLDIRNVTVFQHGFDEDVAKTALEFGASLHQYPRKEGNYEGAVHIADHYGHILSTVFNAPSPPKQLILVEEDMVFSPDLLDYFIQATPILDDDQTVWCISTWNDNGMRSSISDVARLDRTDFFIGLGWLITRRLYKTELEHKWPRTHWDHWMRDSRQRLGRECVYPQVSRNYNIGEIGTHSDGGLFARYFAKVHTNPRPHVKLNIDQVKDRAYEDRLYNELKDGVIVTDLAKLTVKSDVPLLVFVDVDGQEDTRWVTIMKRFGLWDSIPVRGYHRGLIRFRWDDDVDNVVFLISGTSSYARTHKPPAVPLLEESAFATRAKVRPRFTGDIVSLRLIAAVQGQSCDDACKADKLTCEDSALEMVNKCSYLTEHFGCSEGCETNFGYDQPAFVVESSTCYLQGDPNYFGCSGSHPATRRLCPCRKPGAVTG